MTECEHIGISGNCGPACSVYLEGKCDEPEAMVERLEKDELQWHRRVYGDDSMSERVSCKDCNYGGEMVGCLMLCTNTSCTVDKYDPKLKSPCYRFEKKKESSRFATDYCSDCMKKMEAANLYDVVLVCDVCSKKRKKLLKFPTDIKVELPNIAVPTFASLTLQKSKGQKMKTLVKVLRRVIILWCLFGLVKVVLLLNPLMCRLGYIVVGPIRENGIPRPAWDAAVTMWLVCAAGIALFCLASWGLHKCAVLIFNEKK